MTDHVDMSQFIAARSDQLNADDLMDNPRIITITRVTASPDSAEQPVSIHYEGGEGRPFKPCKTMRRIMVAVWGKDASKYVGRSMKLYRDPDVQFGGMKVGGIRVSHMSHIDGDKTVALLVTRGRKAPYTVRPLADAPAADDPAERWTAAYIAKLVTFSTAEAVDSFVVEKAAKLSELEIARPELHARVTEAIQKRIGELKPAETGFDDDLTSDASPAADAVARVIAETEDAADLPTLEKIIADAEQHKAFLPDDLAVKLEVAFDKARQRIAPAEEQA